MNMQLPAGTRAMSLDVIPVFYLLLLAAGILLILNTHSQYISLVPLLFKVTNRNSRIMCQMLR